MADMKDKPILFSTAMVQAILEGRKTQTRRVIKDVFGKDNYFFHSLDDQYAYFENPRHWRGDIKAKFPVELGQKLWVRETFRAVAQEVGEPRFEYKATETINVSDKWTPSIFMPRAASRITLQVIDVRIERVAYITEDDAIAEGILPTEKMFGVQYYKGYHPNILYSLEPVASFATLWESIHGESSFSNNPWVWVIDFIQV